MENQELVANQAYSKMAQLCSRSEQCSTDIRKKIIAFELVSEVVEEIIEKLKIEKFINDERYIKAYISDKFSFNKWGKVKLRHNLRMKGLSEELILNGLNEIDEEKYKTVLIKTMKDKAKTVKNKTKFEKMGQVIRFAQTRGFEPEMIHRYINSALE
ncbi:MAG: RecX family transcriptional regulator [Bacteroidetes bacterium]|nr:RecX family transcriptional regulator [Bacteroidota bacterium]